MQILQQTMDKPKNSKDLSPKTSLLKQFFFFKCLPNYEFLFKNSRTHIPKFQNFHDPKKIQHYSIIHFPFNSKEIFNTKIALNLLDSFHWSLLAAKRSYDKIFTYLSFWTQIRFSAKFNTQNLFVFIFKFYITNSPWMVKRFLSNSFEIVSSDSHGIP